MNAAGWKIGIVREFVGDLLHQPLSGGVIHTVSTQTMRAVLVIHGSTSGRLLVGTGLELAAPTAEYREFA